MSGFSEEITGAAGVQRRYWEPKEALEMLFGEGNVFQTLDEFSGKKPPHHNS